VSIFSSLPQLQRFGAKKFFSERYGLFFATIRTIMTTIDTYRVEEVEMKNVNAFIMNSTGESCMIDYHLFRGNEILGGGIFRSKKKDKNKINIDAIISSIKYQEKPIKSAEGFFEKGVTLYNKQDYEKAKFYFASALCLDWENSQYHYYLGSSFIESKNLDSAEEHFEKAISLQPDYPEVQKLLDEIKSKRKSSEQPPKI
jgi:tetratricopeptide (TPR) repeat protein